MAIEASITPKEDGITKALNGMMNRVSTIEGYLDRNLWRQYQKAQIERFQSQSASEGNRWSELKPEYAKRKKRIYASYEGGGNVVMIATGKLAKGAEGEDSSYFYREVSSRGMKVYMNTGSVPYAAYAAEARPYMSFSQATLEEMRRGIRDFIKKGKA